MRKFDSEVEDGDETNMYADHAQSPLLFLLQSWNVVA